MFSKEVNPLFHTPAAITRSVSEFSRRNSNSSAMTMMAVALFTVTAVSNRPNYRIVGTNGLKDRIKGLEKTLQLHPTRSDIRLEIMEIRKQIREIEAENKKARAVNNPKVKKRK